MGKLETLALPRSHGAQFVIRDPRRKEAYHVLRGNPSLDDILALRSEDEHDPLLQAYVAMKGFFSFGGAISKSGRVFSARQMMFTESMPPKPAQRSTGKKLRDVMKVDIDKRRIKTHDAVYLVRPNGFLERFITRHYSDVSVSPYYLGDNGERVSLDVLSKAFGKFIERLYWKNKLDQTYNLDKIAQCFMIQIVEGLQNEANITRAEPHTPQSQPTQLRLDSYSPPTLGSLRPDRKV